MNYLVVIWLLLSIFATGFSLAGVFDTLADKRALKRSGKNGLRQTLIAGQLRSEVLRTLALSLFLGIGIIAGFDPPSFVTAWLLILANGVLGGVVATDWRLRSVLRERVLALHNSYEEPTQPPDQG